MKIIKLKEDVWRYGKADEIIMVCNVYADYQIRAGRAVLIEDLGSKSIKNKEQFLKDYKAKMKDMSSRYDDPTPVQCSKCGWKGKIKDMFHTYRDDGSGEDVEAVDECPVCGTDDVEELR